MRLHAFLILLAITLALAVSLLWFWNMLKPYSDLVQTPAPAVQTPAPAVQTPAPDPEKQLLDLVAAHEASLATLTPAQLEARASGLETVLKDRAEVTDGASAGSIVD